MKKLNLLKSTIHRVTRYNVYAYIGVSLISLILATGCKRDTSGKDTTGMVGNDFTEVDHFTNDKRIGIVVVGYTWMPFRKTGRVEFRKNRETIKLLELNRSLKAKLISHTGTSSTTQYDGMALTPKNELYTMESGVVHHYDLSTNELIGTLQANDLSGGHWSELLGVYGASQKIIVVGAKGKNNQYSTLVIKRGTHDVKRVLPSIPRGWGTVIRQGTDGYTIDHTSDKLIRDLHYPEHLIDLTRLASYTFIDYVPAKGWLYSRTDYPGGGEGSRTFSYVDVSGKVHNDMPSGAYAVWGSDDWIYFQGTPGELWRCRARAGASRELVSGAMKNKDIYYNKTTLSRDRSIIATVYPWRDGRTPKKGIVVVDLKHKEIRRIKSSKLGYDEVIDIAITTYPSASKKEVSQ